MRIEDLGIDVVVCNYRTPHDLADFVVSFELHPPTVPWDLWIANVEPTEQDLRVARTSVERLGEHAHELSWPDNIGYGRACNRSAAYGQREVIGLFNADVMLTDGALDRCYQALLSRTDWGVLGPRQVDQAHRLTAAGIFGTTDAPKHRGWQERDREDLFCDVRDDAVTVSGAAYFVKREVWDSLAACPLFQAADPGSEGGFLSTPHGYEETYFSYHALAHGLRCVYFGEVTVIHKFHRASPIGGQADLWMRGPSREMFRAACDAHGISHD